MAPKGPTVHCLTVIHQLEDPLGCLESLSVVEQIMLVALIAAVACLCARCCHRYIHVWIPCCTFLKQSLLCMA